MLNKFMADKFARTLHTDKISAKIATGCFCSSIPHVFINVISIKMHHSKTIVAKPVLMLRLEIVKYIK